MAKINGWGKIAAAVLTCFLGLLLTAVALTYNQGACVHTELDDHKGVPGHPVALEKIAAIKAVTNEIKADVKELLRRSQ